MGWLIRTRWFTTLLLCCALLVSGRPAGAEDPVLAKRVLLAKDVFEHVMNAPDAEVAGHLVDRAHCIAIIPRVLKAAFLWGGRFGRGVATCRRPLGGWSPPVFIRLTGGSWGFQIGASAADFVLFFMNERGARSLLESHITLGADVSLAAGPVGRSMEASTDLKLGAEIYSYARTRGVFAGISFEGAHFSADKGAISKYYGRPIVPQTILFENGFSELPRSARALVASLPRPTKRR